MNVRVITIKRLEKGNLKGFANVEVDGITINDLRIIQQPGQRAWVSGPQREWQDKEGNRKFSPVVIFEGPAKNAIEEAVLSSWHSQV